MGLAFLPNLLSKMPLQSAKQQMKANVCTDNYFA